MYTVYVLLSKSTGKQYIGQTQDLTRRLTEHEQGIARYTRNRGPWELVHHEILKTRAEAMKRERFLKSGQGREWLKGRLSGRAGPPQAD
ncbi:MAG: GIY-YIG nuclease family protein [Chloroflexi bacterium]|nr:GIY-YIG nuclease family protein [Chloroflexota bacterium]